jgi:hypothetical protein
MIVQGAQQLREPKLPLCAAHRTLRALSAIRVPSRQSRSSNAMRSATGIYLTRRTDASRASSAAGAGTASGRWSARRSLI